MVTALLLTISALRPSGQEVKPIDTAGQPFAKQSEVAFRLSAVDEGRHYRVFACYANLSKGHVKILEPGRNDCYFEYEERRKDKDGATVAAKTFEAEYHPGGLNASAPESSLSVLPDGTILGRSFLIFRAKRQYADSEIWIRCKHLRGVIDRKGETWSLAFQSSWCLVEGKGAATRE